MEVKNGDIICMTSFSHVDGPTRFSYRAPKGHVAAFVLLGNLPKTYDYARDIPRLMEETGILDFHDAERLRGEIRSLKVELQEAKEQSHRLRLELDRVPSPGR